MRLLMCDYCANDGLLCEGCENGNVSNFKWGAFEPNIKNTHRCSICANKGGYPKSDRCAKCSEIMASKFEKDDEKEERLRLVLDESESKREMSILEKIHKFVLWGSIPALCIFIAVFEIIR